MPFLRSGLGICLYNFFSAALCAKIEKYEEKKNFFPPWHHSKMASQASDNATNVWKSVLPLLRSDVCIYVVTCVFCVSVAIICIRYVREKHAEDPAGRLGVLVSGAPSRMVRRRLLILDLNGLLCHRKHVSELHEDIPESVIAHAQRRGNQFVWARPHVDEFLRYCVDRFDVGLWSSATQQRLMEFLPAVVAEDVYARLAFVWSQDQCDLEEGGGGNPITIWKKNLSRVYAAFPQQMREDVLLLDDVVEKVRDNEPYSVMLVRPWCPYGDDGGKGMHDDELRVGVGWLWHEIQELAYYEGSARQFIRERVEGRTGDRGGGISEADE